MLSWPGRIPDANKHNNLQTQLLRLIVAAPWKLFSLQREGITVYSGYVVQVSLCRSLYKV